MFTSSFSLFSLVWTVWLVMHFPCHCLFKILVIWYLDWWFDRSLWSGCAQVLQLAVIPAAPIVCIAWTLCRWGIASWSLPFKRTSRGNVSLNWSLCRWFLRCFIPVTLWSGWSWTLLWGFERRVWWFWNFLLILTKGDGFLVSDILVFLAMK